MIKDEIEQIREAERQALIRIETVENEGRALVQNAQTEVELLIQTKRREAATVVKQMQKEMENEFLKEEAALIEKAEKERIGIRTGVKEKIPVAVTLIRDTILGDTHVLSGSDE